MTASVYYQFDENDRSILEGETEGFVKVHVKKGTDQIIGATIVGDGAGDMIRFVLVLVVYKYTAGLRSPVSHPFS